jgi:hypothetical protein
VNKIEDWLKFDLNERRYITVVNALEPNEGKDQVAPGFDAVWPPSAKTLKTVALASPFAVLLGPLLLPAAALAAGAYALQKADEAAAPPVLRVPRAYVTDIDFGPNGWEPDVVYGANPKQPAMYRSLAKFHEELLVHKISELDRILNALGAREYSISHVSMRGREAGAELSLGPFGGRADAAGLALCERKWSGTSDGHEPSLPDDLVWYPGEREWQSLVDSRLKGTRRKFAFSVRQDESFGVDAALAASFEAINLKIGGHYAGVDHVEFAVAGSF